MSGRAPIAAASLLALAVATAFATSVGAVHLGLADVARALLAPAGLVAPPAPWIEAVVLSIRLPRVLLAATCGGGLAIAGASLQGLLRNPMADPGVIGVSSGAALGAVLALYLAPAALLAWTLPLAALVGALAAMLGVLAIARARGDGSIATLLLAGVAVASLANALTSLVLSVSLADWELGREMLAWMMGGLEGRSVRHLALAAPLVLVGTAFLLREARALDGLALGDEAALAIGVDVPRVQRTVVVLASLVTAATVAVMGVVAFVGLVVPHATRLVIGPRHGALLPMSTVAGAIFLVLADTLSRAVITHDLRLGVVTAATGGPFFLYLLVRDRREAAT